MTLGPWLRRSGLFPSSRRTVSTRRVSVITFSGIRSLHRVGQAGMAPSETVLYPGDEFTSAT